MSNDSRLIKTSSDDLTYQIVGCGMAVHRRLGSGLREDSYQRGLEVEFTSKAVPFQAQVLLKVLDHEKDNEFIGYYIPDFIVADQVIVEIKAFSGIDNSHIAQVFGYLAVTGLEVGLILNFGTRSMQTRRIFPPKNVSTHIVNRQWLFVPDWMKKE